MERKNHIDENIIKRLSKIEGQIRGVKEIGIQGRTCSEILTQMSAIQSAIAQVSKLIMLDHLENCVVRGIQEGDVETTLKDLNSIINQYSKMK